MWILMAAVAAVVMVLVAHLRRAATTSDLGSVTQQWLTEYRADQAADSK